MGESPCTAFRAADESSVRTGGRIFLSVAVRVQGNVSIESEVVRDRGGSAIRACDNDGGGAGILADAAGKHSKTGEGAGQGEAVRENGVVGTQDADVATAARVSHGT